MLGFRPALDALDQQAGGLQAQQLAGLVNAREAVLGEVAIHGVVIAGYAYILGNAQTQFRRHTDDFERDEIGPAEDRIGGIG